MVFCHSCGQLNDDTSNFCINCGTKLIKSNINIKIDIKKVIIETLNIVSIPLELV